MIEWTKIKFWKNKNCSSLEPERDRRKILQIKAKIVNWPKVWKLIFILIMQNKFKRSWMNGVSSIWSKMNATSSKTCNISKIISRSKAKCSGRWKLRIHFWNKSLIKNRLKRANISLLWSKQTFRLIQKSAARREKDQEIVNLWEALWMRRRCRIFRHIHKLSKSKGITWALGTPVSLM